MGLFSSRSFSRAAHLFSFVSFFVRYESLFLRLRPEAVARRSCQGWSRRPAAGLGVDSSGKSGVTLYVQGFVHQLEMLPSGYMPPSPRLFLELANCGGFVERSVGRGRSKLSAESGIDFRR